MTRRGQGRWAGQRVLYRLRCKRCSKWFDPQRDRRRQFCSRKCTRLAQIKRRRMIRCALCPERFEQRPTGARSKRFCSARCGYRARRAKALRDRTRITIRCAQCGRRRTRQANRRRRRNFCTVKCRDRWQHIHLLRPKRNCEQCGRRFRPKRHSLKGAGVFCSQKCHFGARRGRPDAFLIEALMRSFLRLKQRLKQQATQTKRKRNEKEETGKTRKRTALPSKRRGNEKHPHRPRYVRGARRNAG